jgi:restriction system protein
MARKNPSLLDVLATLPWWVNAGLAAATWIFLKFGLPLITFQNPLWQGMAIALPPLATLFASILLLPAAVSALHSWRKSKLLERQAGIQSLNAISWREFEELVGEAYRRQGYRVTETSDGADGGIDLVLKKDGETTLVQCKQWKTVKVGVKVVRELYGVVMAERASRGILIASGAYTEEARAFARGKPLELLSGPELVRLIDAVRKTPGRAVPPVSPALQAARCPRCASAMVRRTAKRGANAGKSFWGCRRYPHCRGIKPCAGLS